MCWPMVPAKFSAYNPHQPSIKQISESSDDSNSQPSSLLAKVLDIMEQGQAIPAVAYLNS